MKISRIFRISFMAVSSTVLIACNPARNEDKAKEIGLIKEVLVLDSTKVKESKEIHEIDSTKVIKQLTVCVIPTSNGYEYAQQGYEIESTLEKSLSKSKKIQLEKFPLYKFKGSGYQGVFDKKHCSKIIALCNADIVVMSRLEGGIQLLEEKFNWGYEIRILDLKTLKQKNSISAKNLESYEAIQLHIEQNINHLVEDMTK